MHTPPILIAALAATACCGGQAMAARPVRARQPADNASASAAASTPAGPAPALSPAQQRYLSLAQAGVAQARKRWWDPRRGWYDSRLNDRARYPLATIWDSVPLFESLDAIALAEPNAPNRRALTRFAAGAERYLNRGLRPIAGYSPYPGDREANTETWFDDDGWWGVAFVEAYEATGRHRYLADAERALHYIAGAGWDADGGGIWWNTEHPYTSGPALAADTLLAALVYQQGRSAFALAQAERFIGWANTGGFSGAEGLYVDNSLSSTPVDYVEAPLIYAQALLCRLASAPSDCQRAEQVEATALRRFGDSLDFSPQYDAIYLQWLLALYALEGDRALYQLAAANALTAQARAANGEGLYLLSWDGQTLPASDAEPGMLQTQAATTSLFAWLAVYSPPAS